jgi:histone-lysine N-methyltransferase NSD2
MTEINNFKKQEREEFEDVVMGNFNKKPAKYVTLRTNKPYSSKLKMVPADTGYRMEESTCDCRSSDIDPCGIHTECINQLTHMECGDNCPALSKCTNKRFKKMQYPESKVFKTDWGGWGLKALVNIERGQLVHEYVGEIVDQTELERRIEVSHQSQIKNYYFLTLDSKRTIDAGPKLILRGS